MEILSKDFIRLGNKTINIKNIAYIEEVKHVKREAVHYNIFFLSLPIDRYVTTISKEQYDELIEKINFGGIYE